MKYITATLLILCLTSGIANATIQEDFDRADVINKEWQMQKMQRDIKEIQETDQEIKDANFD